MNKDQTNSILFGLLGLAVGYGLAYAIASSKNQANAVNPFAAATPPMGGLGMTGGLGTGGLGMTGTPGALGGTGLPSTQSQGLNPMSLLT